MVMQCYDILPSLLPYVKLICTMQCDEDVGTKQIRVLPDTCVELFLNYTSTPVAIISNELHKHSIVSFRMTKPMDVQMRKGNGCLAICFHPGMAYPFFKLPMHLLSDSTTALADIWKDISHSLEDKVACARNNQDRVDIVQAYLLNKLKNDVFDAHIGYCINQAQSSGGLVTVNKLANDLGLSQRHLSRKFQQYVGLSTKEYLRAFKFVRSLGLLKKHKSVTLTEIGYQSGYYDQAHFTRDYKHYAGYTPGEVAIAENILF